MRRAKFDIFKLKPIAIIEKLVQSFSFIKITLSRCTVPAFFAIGEQDELVAPKHVYQLHQSHMGPKQLFKFAGSHNTGNEATFGIII